MLRGSWKWLRPLPRKRKRVEVEDTVESQDEDMGSDGEGQDGGVVGGGQEEGFGGGGGGQGRGIGGWGQGGGGGGHGRGIGGGGQGGGGQGRGIGGRGQGGEFGGGGQVGGFGGGGGGQAGGNGGGGLGGAIGGEGQAGGNGGGGLGGAIGGEGQGGGGGQGRGIGGWGQVGGGGGHGRGIGGGGQGGGGQGRGIGGRGQGGEFGGGGQVGGFGGGGGQAGGNGGGGLGGAIGGEGQAGGNGVGGLGGAIGGEGQGGGDGGGRQNPIILADVPEPIIWGHRSHLDKINGITWTCGTCKTENPPSRNLIVDLPAFECSICGGRTRIDFRFSFGNLATNGECPIGEVFDQGQTNDCLPFALTKGIEMTARMYEKLLGSDLVIPSMDPYNLKETFTLSRLAEGIRYKKGHCYDDEAMVEMLHLAVTVGVQDKNREHTCRIKGFVQVEGDFEELVTEIANGYPLMVDIMPGREFSNLKYGDIYRCPFNNRTVKEGSKVNTHTVLLVGAARLGNIDYFYFLNSYGEWWCVRYRQGSKDGSKDEIGGVGKLFVADICYQPYKFFRMEQQ